MKEVKNKRSARQQKPNLDRAHTKYPESRKKDSCLYVDGEVTLATRGVFKVQLDNGLECVASARKMEQLRVSLLPGDRVTCEIPALGLNPNEQIRGRIVWRFKNNPQN